MRCVAVVLLTAWVPAAAAQVTPLPWSARPASATGPRVVPAPSGVRTFDPKRIEAREVDRRWLLFLDGRVLKDCGPRPEDAREVLRLIGLLKLNGHATLGSPAPVMEYWLSDGGAPVLPAEAPPRLTQIDLNTLRAEEVRGSWVVRDQRQIYFVFGANRAHAYHALDLIRHYGFTHVGAVGAPVPVMVYFVTANADRARQPALAPPPAPAEGEGVVQASHTTAVPAAAVRPLVDRRKIDARNFSIRRDGEDWKLYYGLEALANLGPNQLHAQQALSIVQQYRFTERIAVGGPQPSFVYYLIDGQAPRGVRSGVSSVPLRPDAAVVRQLGAEWVVCDGDRPLINFGDRGDDAAAVARAIHEHRFDRLCRVGKTDGYGLIFLVKSR